MNSERMVWRTGGIAHQISRWGGTLPPSAQYTTAAKCQEIITNFARIAYLRLLNEESQNVVTTVRCGAWKLSGVMPRAPDADRLSSLQRIRELQMTP